MKILSDDEPPQVFQPEESPQDEPNVLIDFHDDFVVMGIEDPE